MSELKLLSRDLDLETNAVLKAVIKAEASLGELRGAVNTIPDQTVVLNSLSLQEAKASSEIENIITTQDELFRSQVDETVSNHTKEVRAHLDALLFGSELVKKNKILHYQDLEDIQKKIKGNDAGIRKQVGTVLKNSIGKVIYKPPSPEKLPDLLDNLLEFINNDQYNNMNPLVKMAVIHYQFESIHPFYDGNGRTGRILNLLYLVIAGKLDLPVLYLSRYIIKNKDDYYHLLQAVRNDKNTNDAWEKWLLYMINGITETSMQTIKLIKAINRLMFRLKLRLKHHFRNKINLLHSEDLINALFRHPYTKFESVAQDLVNCDTLTTSYYLEILTRNGLLKKHNQGQSNYYINLSLVDCLKGANDE